jgi:hypothetical protein
VISPSVGVELLTALDWPNENTDMTTKRTSIKPRIEFVV